jgi:hypothetical protein
MPPQLSTEFKVGQQTPPRQNLTILSSEVTNADTNLLRVAITHSGPEAEVELKTEHGLWTFVVLGGNLGGAIETFNLVSSGSPR